MSNAGFRIFGCLCACTNVLINILAIVIGVLLLSAGVFIAFGVSWITERFDLTEVLKGLAALLQNYLRIDIDTGEVLKYIGSFAATFGATVIGVAVIVIALSCVGCFGTCCKIRPCLIIYAIGVGVLFLAQLILVVIWFADSDTLKSVVKGAMVNNVRNYRGSNGTNVETLVQDLMQLHLRCCGVDNGTDYQSLNSHWDRSYTMSNSGRDYTFNLTYPISCCNFSLNTMQLENAYCPYNNTASNHGMGCYGALFDFLGQHSVLTYLFSGLAGLLGIEALLISGAVVLYFAYGTNKNKVDTVSV